MLAKDFLFVDVDRDQWFNLAQAFAPPPPPNRPGDGPAGDRGRGGTLLIVYEGNRVVKAMRGRRDVAVDAHFPGLDNLEELRRRHGVDRVLAIERGGLPEVFSGAEMRVRHDQDYVKQILDLLTGARAFHGRLYRLHPSLLGRLPAMPHFVLQTSFNLLFPDRRTLVFYLIEEAKVFASVILAKNDGDVTLVTTDDTFGEEGLKAADFRRDYRRLTGLVADRFYPPYFALFAERRAWDELRRPPGRGRRLAQAVEDGTVVIDPRPVVLDRLLAVTARLTAMFVRD